MTRFFMLLLCLVIISAPADAGDPPADVGGFSIDLDAAEAALEQARLLRAKGHDDVAEKLIRAVIARHPNNAEACNALGFLYRLRGEYYSAIHWFKEAADRRPGWARPHYHIGNCYLDLNDLVLAQSTFQRAATLEPDDPAAVNGLGIVYARADRFDKAQAAYNHAISLRPDWIDPHWNLVLLYDRHGYHRESDRHIAAILRLDPAHFDALYRFVEHLIGRRDLAMAERYAERLVSLHPERVESYEALGLVHSSKDDQVAAERAFRRGLEIDPSYPGVRIGMGHLRLRQGAFGDAEKEFRAALETDPELREAHQGLELAQERRRQHGAGGCTPSSSFATVSPLNLLTYLLAMVPVVLVRRRV